MVDAGDRTDDLAGRVVLGDEIGDRAIVALAGEEVLAHLHHAAGGIDGVDASRIPFRAQAADGDATRAAAARTIGREIQPEGVGGIEEDFLRRAGKKHMRIADIKAMSRLSGASSFSASSSTSSSEKVLAKRRRPQPQSSTTLPLVSAPPPLAARAVWPEVPGARSRLSR